MSQHQKLIDRFKSKPNDFTWDELKRLLRHLGYDEQKGDGSRRKFYNSGTGALISLHKPHPGNVLKAYQVTDVLNHLQERGVL